MRAAWGKPRLSHERAGCARPTSSRASFAQVDREIARDAVGCPEIRRLMTIPGIDVTTAATLKATIGRIDRVASPRHLVGYLGPDPPQPPIRPRRRSAWPHLKQGSATARHVLCEAAHATMRSPGPLRAFGQRVRGRRDNKIAIVAVAEKARLPDLAATHPRAGLHLPWVAAQDQNGSPRSNGQVCEITDQLKLTNWPVGSRVLLRRERAQLTFTDHDGIAFQAILTDQPAADIAVIERDHRAHARVEDHIRNDKDAGLRNLPFREVEHKRAWLERVRLAHDLIV
jgi:Transposase IS116/IS110/IS902 family